jgi:uncharacterized membrane protein
MEYSINKNEVPRKAQSPAPRSEIFAPYFAADGEAKRPLSTTIQKSQAEVAAVLRNLQNFPFFFENLESVQTLTDKRSTWNFKNVNDLEMSLAIPMSIQVDVFDQGMIWQSEDAAGFKYSVAVQLETAAAGRGTIVRMMVAYDNLAGEIAGVFEKLFGKDAMIMSRKNLQRFKAFCETGHVPTTEGQSSGREEDQSTESKH